MANLKKKDKNMQHNARSSGPEQEKNFSHSIQLQSNQQQLEREKRKKKRNNEPVFQI